MSHVNVRMESGWALIFDLTFLGPNTITRVLDNKTNESKDS